MKELESFHHWIERRLTGKTDRSVRDEVWGCPLVEEAIEEGVLWPMH